MKRDDPWGGMITVFTGPRGRRFDPTLLFIRLSLFYLYVALLLLRLSFISASLVRCEESDEVANWDFHMQLMLEVSLLYPEVVVSTL